MGDLGAKPPGLNCEVTLKRRSKMCGKPATNIVLSWRPDWAEEMWGALNMCPLHTTWAKKDKKLAVKVIPFAAIVYEHDVEVPNGSTVCAG